MKIALQRPSLKKILREAEYLANNFSDTGEVKIITSYFSISHHIDDLKFYISKYRTKNFGKVTIIV